MRASYRRFEAWEDEALRREFADGDLGALSARLGRSVRSVETRARRSLGLTRSEEAIRRARSEAGSIGGPAFAKAIRQRQDEIPKGCDLDRAWRAAA